MNRTMSFYDVRDALVQPGCAICRLKASVADWYLDGLLWECVNDPGVRRNIRQARGFCREHGWGLVRHGASLGVAILMRDVLENVLKEMEGVGFQPEPAYLQLLRRVRKAVDSKRPASTDQLAAQLEPRAKCPACVSSETMEGIYLDALVENLLGEDGLLAAYEASEGLCLPHFRQALNRVHDEAVFEALVNAQRAIWGWMVGHLSEIIRKNDYRFRGEPLGEEVGGALRAIAVLSGPRPG
jgi:hypothetical protein